MIKIIDFAIVNYVKKEYKEKKEGAYYGIY